MREYSGKQVERMKTNYDASIKPRQFEVGAFVLLFTPQRKKNVYGRWHVAWQGPFRVMKKLNQSNYVIQRSSRSRSFVVHGDRLRDYRGKVEPGTWPVSMMDAAQGAHDTRIGDDLDSDSQQQQQQGRSRAQPVLAPSQMTDQHVQQPNSNFCSTST